MFVHADTLDGWAMDALTAIFDVLLALLGIYQEQQVTKEQCERMWSEGYVIYPLSAEELERAQKCRDLLKP